MLSHYSSRVKELPVPTYQRDTGASELSCEKSWNNVVWDTKSKCPADHHFAVVCSMSFPHFRNSNSRESIIIRKHTGEKNGFLKKILNEGKDKWKGNENTRIPLFAVQDTVSTFMGFSIAYFWSRKHLRVYVVIWLVRLKFICWRQLLYYGRNIEARVGKKGKNPIAKQSPLPKKRECHFRKENEFPNENCTPWMEQTLWQAAAATLALALFLFITSVYDSFNKCEKTDWT